MKSSFGDEYNDFESDQELKRPQPPLVKANMREIECAMDLPRNFGEMNIKKDLIEILTEQKSSRVYTNEPMSLLQALLPFMGFTRRERCPWKVLRYIAYGCFGWCATWI